jgi:acyl-CoA synthetase (AMP-forming)/AMP-acid ligase II
LGRQRRRRQLRQGRSRFQVVVASAHRARPGSPAPAARHPRGARGSRRVGLTAAAARRGRTSRTGWTPTARSSSANASPAPFVRRLLLPRTARPCPDEDGWFAIGDLGERDQAGGLRFLERAAESIRVKGEFVPIPYVEECLGTIPELVDLALKKRGELVDDDVVLFAVADTLPVDEIRSVAIFMFSPMMQTRCHSIYRE